jgi:cell division protease FtsH
MPQNDQDDRPDRKSRRGDEPERNKGEGRDGKGEAKPDGQAAAGGMRFNRGITAWLVLLAGLVLLLFVLNQGGEERSELELSLLLDQAEAANLEEFLFKDAAIHGTLKNPIPHPTIDGQEIDKFITAIPRDFDTGDFQATARTADPLVVFEAEPGTSLWVQVLISLLPWVLILGFLYFFVFRQIRSAAGPGGMLGNFGRSKHRMLSKEHTHQTFDDVAGVEEAKDEVHEIVEFLRNPKKFQRLGGRIPRGVLLVGPPGTGKTLLAKAIAGEADVPFFSISGSDFVEMFVGVGASRVRDLFKQAKDNSPCIIFLDEIDAVGRRRGNGTSSGGHDEREQTLNAILVEMDGFETNDQVIVVASTNRVDVLDPALTRPGRFDRQVQVPLPDVKGRMAILKVHARKVKLGPNVDLARLAKATPGFSGADLAAIINEAALGATLAGKDFIEQEDMEEARDKVRFGRAKKSRVMDEKDKIATAYHEAGHAVVQALEKHADPLHKVTIIPRGPFGGATMSLPEKDRTNYSKKWCVATIRTLFAGRIAEELFTDDVNTGVLSDIQKATELVRRMITEWGMNDEIGFIYYGEDENKQGMFDLTGRAPYSDETARKIDHEVKQTIDDLFGETERIIHQYKDQVEAVAKALMRYETLDQDDVNRLIRGEELSRPSVSELLAEEKRRLKGDKVVTPPKENDGDVQLGGALPSPG